MYRGERDPGAELPRPGADRGEWKTVCRGEFYVRKDRSELEEGSSRYLMSCIMIYVDII